MFQLVLLFLQASRILANLIVAGGSVIVRAAATAWRQAVVSKLQHFPMPSKLLLTSCSRSDFGRMQMDKGVA